MKTFILAPNFTYHPDTSICMGDIIADPSDPTKPLSSLSRADLEAVTHMDYDAELNKTTSTLFGGSIWATFLQTASVKLHGEVKNDATTKYTIDRLETIYYKKQPTDDQAAQWVLEPRVAAAINSGLVRKKPVYMVSALKIARGFRVASGVSASRSAGVGAAAPVTPEVGLGADVDVTRSRSAEQSFRSTEDIVFAYQLHVIAHKGWRQDQAAIGVYKSKAAFLSEDKTEAESGKKAVEASAANEQDVRHAFSEDMVEDVLEAVDGEELVQCIVFREPPPEEESEEEEDDDD